MISTFGYRFGKTEYLTSSEKTVFLKLVESGAISFFDLGRCRCIGCESYVPKGIKKYCSYECYKKENGDQEDV